MGIIGGSLPIYDRIVAYRRRKREERPYDIMDSL